MNTSGWGKWSWSRLTVTRSGSPNTASSAISPIPPIPPVPPIPALPPLPPLERLVNIEFKKLPGGALRVACTCGFEMDVPNAAGARHVGQVHKSQHDLGVADVECAFCGDIMPVSVATACMTTETPANMKYVCPSCAEPVPEIDPKTLIEDLRSLRDELSE